MKTEAQNLIKLPVKDLAKKAICDGHLYLTSGSRKFYVMKPGIFVDPSFIKKHAANNASFEFHPVVDLEVKEKFKLLLRELKYLQFEKDLRLKSVDIIEYFYRSCSEGAHFLAFALACHEEFCKIPLEEQNKIHETDMHLFRKSLYSSAFSVIIALANGYYHFMMVKDFYNLTFALDVGLCEENYSYFVAEACNKENQNPGSGRKYLEEEKASAFEREVFENHPQKSYDFLFDHSILSFPELIEATLYQHELSDGTGFPRGIRKGQVSNWEAILILADSLVEIVPEYDFENDVVSYLENFQNRKLKDIPVTKVYTKLMLAFGHFKTLKETGS